MGAIHLLIALFRWLDKQQREAQAAAAAQAGGPPAAPPQAMNAGPARPGTFVASPASTPPRPAPAVKAPKAAPGPQPRPNASIVDDAPAGFFGRLLRLLE